jgi:arylsulfatase A-like enzyme
MLHVTGQKAWKAGHRLNGELLGFKFGAWEGGHRIPFIARWPGKIPAGSVSDGLFSQVDILATVASIVGRSLEEGEGPDSVDQLETLTGTPASPVRETLIISPNSPKHLTVRHQNWVYIPARDEGGFQGKKPGDHLLGGAAALPFCGRANSDVVDGRIRAAAPPAQLYDLDEDPCQAQNLHADRPDVVEHLNGILEDCRLWIPPGEPLGWINLGQ